MTDADNADDLVLLAKTPPKPNPCCIVWSNQQEALVSAWTLIKLSLYDLNNEWQTLNKEIIQAPSKDDVIKI